MRSKKNITVHAFEPNRRLISNLKKIQKKFKNFKYYSCALGHENKKKSLYLPKYKSLYNHYLSSLNLKILKKKLIEDFSTKNKLFTFEKKNISIKKLDNFNFKPDFIKIDTEGYEFEVIKGSLMTIKLSKPIILFEHNEINISKKVLNLLSNFNYKFYMYINSKFEKFNINKKYKIGKLQENIFCIPKSN